VLADLAAVLDLPALYDDITNDMLAVGAVPYFVEAPDAPAQYLPYGTGAVRVLPDYAHAWPGSALVAAHHARAADGFELGRRGRFWDELAGGSTSRSAPPHRLQSFANSRARRNLHPDERVRARRTNLSIELTSCELQSRRLEGQPSGNARSLDRP